MSDHEKDALTQAIHADVAVENTRDIAPPLHLTSTFHAADAEAFADMANRPRHPEYYTRYGNPTVERAEAVIASLEGTESALMFATGMAAISTAALALLKSGDHVVAQTNHYMGTSRLLDEMLARWGINCTLVDQTDPAAFEQAMSDRTRLVILETPSNPKLELTDLAAVADVARRRGVLTLCDNTVASPWNQKPADLGVDIVAHSATKFLGGHHDLVAGCLAGSSELMETIWKTSIVLGGSASPLDAWLLLRGMRSLGLRMRQHNATGQAVAEFLEQHAMVHAVHYPGLKSHPQHELAARQMNGFSGLLSFSVASGYDGATQFMSALKLVRQAVSLGGFESLAAHAAAMWAGTLGEEGALAAGIQPDLIRLSVGLESCDDIIADLDQALTVLRSTK